MRFSLALLLLPAALFARVARAESLSANVDALVGEAVRPGAVAIAKQRVEIGRLPVYSLELDVAPSLDGFAVHEEIALTHRGTKPLEEVVLFIYANLGGATDALGRPPVRMVDGACTSPACSVSVESPGVLRVAFAQPLRAGNSATIALTLEAHPKQLDAVRLSSSGQTVEALGALLHGANSSDYGLLSAAEGVLSAGGFMAVLAPRDEHGTWASPPQKLFGDLTSDDLAHVRAKVRVPPGVRLASVGRVVNEGEGPAGVRELDIAAGLVRDFAFVATHEPAVFERQVDDVLVRVQVSERARERGSRMLEAATDSLALFEQSFGPYPYRELEVVEAPLRGGVGGVEFSGIVTIATALVKPSRKGGISNLLDALTGILGSDAGALMPDPGELLDLVTAHEVAHQWWHVLVGSDSRAEPFVDEGLAQWSALFFLEQKRGTVVAARARKQLALSYQTMRLLGEPDAPVRQPADSFSSQHAYAGLVYGKGPLGYDRLRKLLGNQRFMRTLASYAQRYAFRMAPRDGFEALASKAANPRAVRALTRRWWDEAHGDEDIGTLSVAGRPFDLGAFLGGGARGGRSDALMQLRALMEQLLGNMR